MRRFSVGLSVSLCLSVCSCAACCGGACCRLCGHHSYQASLELSLFESHCHHLRDQHGFLAPLVSHLLALDPAYRVASETADAAALGAPITFDARGKVTAKALAFAIRSLSHQTTSPCASSQQQRQQQQQQPQLSELDPAAFAAACTSATTQLLLQVDGLVPLNTKAAAAAQRRLLLALSAVGGPSFSLGDLNAELIHVKQQTPGLTQGQQQQQQQLSPPATAARGETTLARLLQEQEAVRLPPLLLLLP